MKDLFTDSLMSLFNEGWKFKAPDSGNFIDVTLPHSWNAEGWSYEAPKPLEPQGTGVYEKHIDGKTYNGCMLKFEGVSAYCEVYINGVKVAENIGAHKPFVVGLQLQDGDNVITVEVTDKASLELLPENCDDVFSASPRYKRWPIGYGSSLKAGGIWRNVYLFKKTEVYMNPFVITSNGKGFDVVSDIDGEMSGYKIICSASDETESVTTIVDANCEKISLNLENPVLSWPLKPHIYEFQAQLIDKNGNIVQTITQPAYIMNFTVRNSEFRLNNKPYFLRGQNGFPHCNVPHDKEYIKSYANAIKEQGVEISRFHTEPPSHPWLDECDRKGIMVILEMPLHGSYGCYSYGSKQFCENALSETLSIVREFRRHPSIVMWSMGNELIVSAERDLGLGNPLFDLLEKWIYEVRKLDCRPVISNSNGDAANLVNKTVGDIDDVHQYGGWYTENIYDLRHFCEYTNRNDMLFQPCISTESIAGYTDENEEFFLKHNDIRQKKVIAMRIGEIEDLRKQSVWYQSFLLKEYAEAMWRLRVPDSSFSGYIPFGQYTWFFKPFDKDGITPKTIWSTYQKVMGAVHIQFECFDRHIEKGECLSGKLRVWNENIHLPENAVFEIFVKDKNTELYKETVVVPYHQSHSEEICVGPFEKDSCLALEVYCDGKKVSHNDFEFRVYEKEEITWNEDLLIYDPEQMLDMEGTRLDNLNDISNCKNGVLCVGPYSLDSESIKANACVYEWISNGGKAVVLEQNPGYFSENIFNSGISSARVCQPRWSRWAMNLVKHADRVDICHKKHYMFHGIGKDDMFWWNGDTYLADSYIYRDEEKDTDIVVSSVGNGLSEGELMPVKYEYRDSGYSITTIERKIGKGKILVTSLLLGTKYKYEPIAKKILKNTLGV